MGSLSRVEGVAVIGAAKAGVAIASAMALAACAQHPTLEEARALFAANGIAAPQGIERAPYAPPGQLIYSAYEPPHQATPDLCVSREDWLEGKPRAAGGLEWSLGDPTTIWVTGDCGSARFNVMHHTARGVSVAALPDVIALALRIAHGDKSLGVAVSFESGAIRTAAADAAVSNLWEINRDGDSEIDVRFFVPAFTPDTLDVALVYDGERLVRSRISEGNGPDIVRTRAR